MEKDDIMEVEPKEGTREDLELDSGIELEGRGWNNERDENVSAIATTAGVAVF